MKKKYELYLMQHVTGSVADDYATRHIEYIGSYTSTVKAAKDFSLHLGEDKVRGYDFSQRQNLGWNQPLDKGLAAVKIVCYTKTTETDYEVVFEEYFEQGKSTGKEYWN